MRVSVRSGGGEEGLEGDEGTRGDREVTDQVVHFAGVGLDIACRCDGGRVLDDALRANEVVTTRRINPADERFPVSVVGDPRRIDAALLTGLDQQAVGARAVHRPTLTPVGREQRTLRIGSADDGQMITDRVADSFGQRHAAPPDPLFVDAPSPFQVAAGDGDFLRHVLAIPNLPDRDRKQFLDAVAGGATEHHEESVARAAGGGKVGDEGEVFWFREGASAHTSRDTRKTE
jgi:hypothetical protein